MKTQNNSTRTIAVDRILINDNNISTVKDIKDLKYNDFIVNYKSNEDKSSIRIPLQRYLVVNLKAEDVRTLNNKVELINPEKHLTEIKAKFQEIKQGLFLGNLKFGDRLNNFVLLEVKTPEVKQSEVKASEVETSESKTSKKK